MLTAGYCVAGGLELGHSARSSASIFAGGQGQSSHPRLVLETLRLVSRPSAACSHCDSDRAGLVIVAVRLPHVLPMALGFRAAKNVHILICLMPLELH